MTKQSIIETIKCEAVGIYSEDEFDLLMDSRKTLTIKLGADPSRPDLHLGHSVILRKLRLFQELGHQVVFVIGDFTGMIGDPTGKSRTRPALTLEETREAGKTYFHQVTKILDASKTSIRYNSEWLDELKFKDVIHLASQYTLARIMERDDFKTRFESNQPISLHELFYPLMQGYDSIALDADIEIGGTDQTFNMLVGRTLQVHYGQKQQVVITYPIIAGLDGVEKMSKSLDNYIGIDEPADSMFEKCMKIPDTILKDYFVLTTDIKEVKAQGLIEEDIREAHFAYAERIVAMYHDENAAINAKQRYIEVAKGSVPQNLKTVEITQESISIIELIKLAGFASSNGEARRCILGKGIKIDQIVIENANLVVCVEQPIVLQFGKNRFVEIRQK
ncbi:MAG: tyrosine--tRNA ligase [Clostridiales bacterium]|nr:tyrosine--tRNA ligase [Clostridiales bacterium]